MKIVIIGDGKVGYMLAKKLSEEDYDIVLIDSNEKKLGEAMNRLDVFCVTGEGGSVEVQKSAGVPEADLVIACTSTDECNMLSCLIARRLGARHTIARVRNPIYFKQIDILKEDLHLSMAVNPEMTVAGEELLLCGYAGLEGTLRILDESEEELGTRFVPVFLEKAKLLREKLVLPDQILSVKEQVSDIRQIGSGGILAALWELGEELQTGFDIDFSKIALKQETVEICEFYQLNPYLMTSAGSFLLVTGQSEEVIACLAEQGVSAVRLGCMKDQNARVIKNGEETRYLDRPAADELARWWKEHA